MNDYVCAFNAFCVKSLCHAEFNPIVKRYNDMDILYHAESSKYTGVTLIVPAKQCILPVIVLYI